jgi:membrane-associated HD superfamily phosphohydrolase
MTYDELVLVRCVWLGGQTCYRDYQMSLSGTILGLVNIAITVGLFILVGVIIMWFCSWAKIDVPANVQKAYMIVVALIALYMVIALLFGIPTFGFIGPHRAVM